MPELRFSLTNFETTIKETTVDIIINRCFSWLIVMKCTSRLDSKDDNLS